MEPASVIVTGSWHVPDHYQDFAKALQDKGFKHVRCPRLPTTVDNLPVSERATLAADTQIVRHELQILADLRCPITIFCHSYGGVVATNSVHDFLWTQRRAAGKPGGVVHIVYMAAFVLPLGKSLRDAFADNVPEWMKEDDINNLIDIENHRMTFYNDLDNMEAQKWLKKNVLNSLHSFRDPLSSVPYDFVGKGLDATYLVCKQDYRLPIALQEGMATLLGEHRKMEYVDRGHCATTSAPNEVAAVIWKAWEISKIGLLEPIVCIESPSRCIQY